MKNLIGIFSLIAVLGMSIEVEQDPKTKTVKFITSAVCGQCEERIEEKLNYTKGVIYADLDIETKMLTVKYKSELISADSIKEILASIGYSSDTVIRNREAYLALPKCCREEGNCEPSK